MTLNLDLSTLPEYEARKAAFDGALTAARAANDDTAVARAELQWERDQRELTNLHFARAQQVQAVEAARLRVQAEYQNHPTVMAAVASLQDPEAIASTAAAVAASLGGPPPNANAPVNGQPPGTAPPAPPASQWPAAPTGAPPPPPPPDDPLDDPAVYRQTFETAMTHPPHIDQNGSPGSSPWQAEGAKALETLELRALRRMNAGRPPTQIVRDPSSLPREELFKGRP
jgi:hypothetical protein